MDRHLITALKLCFVALCCGASASLSWDTAHVFYCMESDHQRALIKSGFGAILMFSVLVVAVILGVRGRQSASWAVLAYGSWTSMFWVSFLCDLVDKPRSFTIWASLAVIAVFTLGGLREALRDRWGGMMRWWFASLILLVIHRYFLG